MGEKRVRGPSQSWAHRAQLGTKYAGVMGRFPYIPTVGSSIDTCVTTISSTFPKLCPPEKKTDTSNRYTSINSTPQNTTLRVAEVPSRRNTNEFIQHIDVKSLTKSVIAHTPSAAMGMLTRCGHNQLYVEWRHPHILQYYVKLVT